MVAGIGRRVDAAEWTAAEKANVRIVNEFCAVWPGHDITKIMSFFVEDCVYRPLETAEPVKGRDVIAKRIGPAVKTVVRFEVLDTLAKGPMVINERIDHFSSGSLRRWHGVGVFWLKDGKIVEWSDYTISMERA